VELEISGEEHLSLEEVRHTMTRALKRAPDFWESSGRDLSEVLSELEGAESIGRIWQVVTPLLI
jgi:hypothetical protein